MSREIYTQGEYLKNYPTWHVEDSPWKAQQIIRIIERNHVMPKTICEVGCGAGEVLRQLQVLMDKDCMFWGYEISPQAFELCKAKANEKLHYELKDILQDENTFFDMILLIDLIEHLEDYFSFLRGIKSKSKYIILHIPLELSAQMALRSSLIIRNIKSAGHIHWFTKDIALCILEDVGYEIIDYFYTPNSVDLPNRTIKQLIAKWPRKLLFSIHKDWAVRILGGYSLMVLAK